MTDYAGEVYDPNKHGQAVPISADAGEVYDPAKHGALIPIKGAGDPDEGKGIGGTADDLVRAAVDGLTFGLGDKAIGLVKSIGSDKSVGDNIKDEMAHTQRSFDRHPVAGTVASVVGSLPTLLIPGVGEANEARIAAQGAGTAAKAFLKTAGKGALTGAGYGAASGAGHADSWDNVIPDAIKGGVTGAALGGVAAPALSALPDVLGAIAKSKFKNIGGVAPEAMQKNFDSARTGPGLTGGWNKASDTLDKDLPQATSAAADALRKAGTPATSAQEAEAAEIARRAFSPNKPGFLDTVLSHKFGVGRDNNVADVSAILKGDNPVLKQAITANPQLANQVAGTASAGYLPTGKLVAPIMIGGHIIPGAAPLAHSLVGTSSPITGKALAYGAGKIMKGADKSPLSLQDLSNLLANITQRNTR